MSENVPIYKRWREEVKEWQRRGEAAEAIAAQHPEIPFTVCPITKELAWNEHGENIQAFSKRVRQVAAIFGAAHTVDTQGNNGGKAPDMRAKWELDGKITVEIRAYAPQCRTHPESKYVPAVHLDGTYPAIHPECADVLKELEDCVS